MDKAACKEQIYQLVFPSHPNEWEVDEIVDTVSELRNGYQETLLSQIPVIWPISHSLCLSFLQEGSRVIHTIPSELVPQWVRTILRSYEKAGLGAARQYISEADEKFLQPLHSQNRVRFAETSARLLYYIRGISGKIIDIQHEPIALTNTTTIFVPSSLALLPGYRQNQLMYKFLLTLHWGFVRQGTFFLMPPESQIKSRHTQMDADASARKLSAAGSLPDFFSRFDDAELAADLFFILEAGRVMAWIREELPGLAKQFSEMQEDLAFVLSGEKISAKAQAVTDLAWSVLFGNHRKSLILCDTAQTDSTDIGAEPVFSELTRLYEQLTHEEGAYVRPPLLDQLGRHDFSRTAAEIEKVRLQNKEAFILHLQKLQITKPQNQEPAAAASSESADRSMIVLSDNESNTGFRHSQSFLDNPDLELPEELRALIGEIEADLGHIPSSYFSAAAGVAGKGFNRGDGLGEQAAEQAGSLDSMVFDEWDYRRNGYRKNWCQLYEKPLPVLQSTFVASTLEKHRGLLLKLRRQFELIKTSEQFVRRQREGDDLDLDAIIEAWGDQRAGISPSDKLFVRLQRNERDIATLFLIDMSNSTEGWVGTVIKEALVLLCEVMEVAGDPYGIIGFSGMRRSRCETFLIKKIEEPYNQLIHQRINSIQPREYTRMGPAIRYATEYLKQCEARTRLLVTITDGKPEDYDDYKGEYAIEDTRKALMEARGCGMHAFCITVDREAQDYLPQMFGRGNYIFIDDLKKLPVRLIEMYRLLTT